MLADLLRTLNINTQLCVAVDITLPTEYIRTMSIGDWKNVKLNIHKRPAIFIIHKE